MTIILCLLLSPLVGAWAALVLMVAEDAFAPEIASEPVLFERKYVLDRYRERRLAEDRRETFEQVVVRGEPKRARSLGIEDFQRLSDWLKTPVPVSS